MSISSLDNCFGFLDKVKFSLSLLMFFLSLIIFFLNPEMSLVSRLISFSVLFCLSLMLFIFNRISRSFFAFCKDSFFEAKKVSWPDRKSAIKMTGTVCVFAVLLSVFICLIDKVIDFFLYGVLLGWR